MNALVLRKGRPQRRLRRLCTPARMVGKPLPDRPDAGDDEACELIGPGNDRSGDAE